MPPIRKKKHQTHKEVSTQRYGVQLNKAYGQHFLKNPHIISGIVDRADLEPTDTVLEIGPGSGNLTLKLLGPCMRACVCVTGGGEGLGLIWRMFEPAMGCSE